MSEYIEREALIQDAEDVLTWPMLDRINRQPAADVESVRHGKWLINSDGYYPYCSECKEEPKSGIMTHYCPNCGAKMDKEDET